MYAWISVSTELPPVGTLVLVEEIIEDDCYPEPILMPELACMNLAKQWETKTGRHVHVVGWMYIPPMCAFPGEMINRYSGVS